MWRSSQSHLEDDSDSYSDSEPSHTYRSDSEQADTETADEQSKSDKTPKVERFLGNPGVNVDRGKPFRHTPSCQCCDWR